MDISQFQTDREYRKAQLRELERQSGQGEAHLLPVREWFGCHYAVAGTIELIAGVQRVEVFDLTDYLKEAKDFLRPALFSRWASPDPERRNATTRFLFIPTRVISPLLTSGAGKNGSVPPS